MVHVALRLDEGIAWFIDGYPSTGSGMWTEVIEGTSNDLRFGGFEFDLAEVALFDTAIPISRLEARAGIVADYADHVLDDEPFLYWRLDGSVGDIADYSGNGLDGTTDMYSTPTVTEGAAGTSAAVAMERSDAALTTVAQGLTSSDFSIDLWMRGSAGPPVQGAPLLSWHSTQAPWQLTRGPAGGIVFEQGDLTLTSSPDVLGGHWTHVAVTVDESSAVLWIDGEINDEAVLDDHDGVPSAAIFLAGDGAGAGWAFDELAVYEHVLSSEEIARRAQPRGPPASVVEFAYDGNNLRRQRTVDGVVTRYGWDLLAGLPQVATETTNDGETRRWVHDGFGPVQVEVDETEWFLHRDALGSVVAVSDEQGELAAQFDYDAFGNVTGREVLAAGLPDGLERFADGTWEPELGLWFLRARYYDPTLGTFTAVDPIDTALGDPYMSRYSYVGGRPTVFVDPSGLKMADAGYQAVSAVVDGIDYLVSDPLGALEAFGTWAIEQGGYHMVLEVLGFVPVIGIVFDGINGILYWAEGHNLEAGLAFGAMIPIFGDAVAGTRIVKRTGAMLSAGATKVTRHTANTFRALPQIATRSYDNVAAFASKRVDSVAPWLKRGGSPKTPRPTGGGTDLVRVADFADDAAAFRHYSKHAKGIELRPNGGYRLKSGGADMPEFSSFGEYHSAARGFMGGQCPTWCS